MDERLWQTLSPMLGLSPKQTDIVKLVLSGLENEEIAAVMGNKTSTIRVHLKAIYARTDCKNRVSLILKVFRLAQRHAIPFRD